VCGEVKNVVFMGMGEPLDNYEEVVVRTMLN
jgi:adenine C2-methylase RlmN of 23S rRNA A2503 and tRNA A37